ncbi:NAD(P)H-quinone oxidoreductase [Arsukibacterium indicum]|uniref:NAD(P)H-quinone oxidoreductase n=1 Tax=Arsukibacterium indicum TaxID=2848612 RepID=A0ABS6MNP7_9GAMM|nr:NAD(P)H-quinone oxidoreductase [Arsukibacterium indicum]MBV2129956.1 NAD(P)H-quinone oxidoreductase [Arsukibacterium indicum]
MTNIPLQMQVVNVLQPGKNSALHIEKRPVPQPQQGQLLLKVKAAGVNRADLMQRQGLYPPPPGESDILGLEVAGTVVKVASKADEHWLGKDVFGIVAGGGYAEYALLQSGHAIAKPKRWSWLQAGAAAEAFLTAYQLLFVIGGLKSGQRLLLHAGASGIGTSALQLATLAGARVAVTVGRSDKAEACRKLSAELAVNYRNSLFADELTTHWPTGVDLILDPVAGEYLQHNVRVLAEDGLIIIYALMGGRIIEQLDLAPLFKKRGRIVCSTLRNRTNSYKAQLTAGFVATFAEQMNNGIFAPILDQSVDWKNAQQAHNVLLSNNNVGKLVLEF